MLKTRIIPCLLLRGASLVKTVKFGRFEYIGDPINTVRIFNELEVDELIFLDISATKEGRSLNLKILSEIADECFMPLCYGGGVKVIDDIKAIFRIGLEKVTINSYAFERPEFITEAAEKFGSQSILVSIDVKRNLWGKYEVCTVGGTRHTKRDPVEYAIEMEKRGAGELLLTAIDREGTWSGFDVELVEKVTSAVRIPVIANGGAGSIEDIRKVIKDGKASAVALGSMVVYQKKDMGVLVNFPSKHDLKQILDFQEIEKS
jgi:cyclase